ncbi:NfeD family protein [Pseudomaricurvus alkylphenolicus]|jgi:membrane protein implicated in regulation of membrane protease activity|uniref:NfeD family protein n=1 Tax=Pseudomaricurvus alkylphenolicus TaxID=1306991 RepID=UPI001421DD28|nr:NfeD family protein [Pseudomaricurvus alkylphenolicus]NIB41936.1 NfeD family protein [Pseudomaricurvus alkylphenolicus]
MEFLQTMEPWHWMALGIAILAVEVWASTEVLLGIGLGALAVAIVHKIYPGLSWQMQIVWFAVFSVGTTVVYWKKFRASRQSSDQPLLNRRAQQLVGKTVPLLEPIVNGQGKVQIADALWTVQGPDMEKGAVVRVVSAEGMTLTVEAVD